MKTHYFVPIDRIHEIERNILAFGSLEETLAAFCEEEILSKKELDINTKGMSNIQTINTCPSRALEKNEIQ
jgi:hypothetical protein